MGRLSFTLHHVLLIIGTVYKNMIDNINYGVAMFSIFFFTKLIINVVHGSINKQLVI